MYLNGVTSLTYQAAARTKRQETVSSKPSVEEREELYRDSRGRARVADSIGLARRPTSERRGIKAASYTAANKFLAARGRDETGGDREEKKTDVCGASTRSVSRARDIKMADVDLTKSPRDWRLRRTIRDAGHARARACRVPRLLTGLETHQLDRDLPIANRSVIPRMRQKCWSIKPILWPTSGGRLRETFAGAAAASGAWRYRT